MSGPLPFNADAEPAKIDGQDTHFKAGSIGKPRGVVFDGDLTGWGTKAGLSYSDAIVAKSESNS